MTERESEDDMRLIDADELIEHAYRDRLDIRERIADMIKSAPTVAEPIEVEAAALQAAYNKGFQDGIKAVRDEW